MAKITRNSYLFDSAISHLGLIITNIMEKKQVKQQQHQSESITFRLDGTILNKLHHEAEQRDIRSWICYCNERTAK